MYKVLSVALVVWLAQPLPALAESTYRLYQGDVVKGLTTRDGKPVRTSDTVCRNNDCYQVLRFYSFNRQALKAAGVDSYNYDAIARSPAVRAEGDGLVLPEALGWALYRDARRDSQISRTKP